MGCDKYKVLTDSTQDGIESRINATAKQEYKLLAVTYHYDHTLGSHYVAVMEYTGTKG